MLRSINANNAFCNDSYSRAFLSIFSCFLDLVFLSNPVGVWICITRERLRVTTCVPNLLLRSSISLLEYLNFYWVSISGSLKETQEHSLCIIRWCRLYGIRFGTIPDDMRINLCFAVPKAWGAKYERDDNSENFVLWDAVCTKFLPNTVSTIHRLTYHLLNYFDHIILQLIMSPTEISIFANFMFLGTRCNDPSLYP